MVVFIDGREAGAAELQAAQGRPVILFAHPGEADIPLLPPSPAAELGESTSSHFESRRGVDYVLLKVPDKDNIMGEPARVDIYLEDGRLMVLHENLPAVECLLLDLRARQHDNALAPVQALNLFFNHLTADDSAALSDMEEEIGNLEDSMMGKVPLDCTAEISSLRKKLLVLKRYYEALFDLLEDMEENQNGLFTDAQLRSLHLLTNRADRLARAVLNLRDYVTQVREAYQAQIDINMNEVMKVFTVITAVFLPLGLIAGWYGMNLSMPEAAHPYAYPLVILFSIAVAAGCLLFFKRKKWF